MTTETQPEVTENYIKSIIAHGVYSGQDGKCCCGCAGKYSYAKKQQAEAGKRRGYDVGDDEINERMITKVRRIMLANIERVEYVTEAHVSVVMGERLYMLFGKLPYDGCAL